MVVAVRETVRPEALPAGFAECGRGVGKAILFEIGDGVAYDLGIRDYGEFIVNVEYAAELLEAQAVPWDSDRCRVMVVARFENAVQLKWERC